MKFQLTDGTGSVNLRYVERNTTRHGGVRYYVRVRGVRIGRLTAEPGSRAFIEQHRALLSGETPADQPVRPVPVGRPAAQGTIAWLCQQYYASPKFKALERNRVRRQILDRVCDEIGTASAKHLLPRHVRKLRDDRADAPAAANSIVKALRQLYRWAGEALDVQGNPALEVAYLSSNNPDGFHEWSEQEIQKYEACHPVGTMARLALDLFLYTGVRKSDACRLGPQMEQRGCIVFTEYKGRRRNPKHRQIPILPVLRASIDATPSGHLAYLVTAFGKPFTAPGLGNRMRKWCDAAGLPQCSAHGLRKAGAIRCAERGATEHQLMALFGWDSPKQAALYTRKANRTRLTNEAMRFLDVQTDDRETG
jgi:integrase